MTVSSTTMGMLYGASYGATVPSAAAKSMEGALMASVTYGEAGLAAAPVETQLLNLSYGGASGTSMFDVLGAYYGASGGRAEMLAAYAEALQMTVPSETSG